MYYEIIFASIGFALFSAVIISIVSNKINKKNEESYEKAFQAR